MRAGDEVDGRWAVLCNAGEGKRRVAQVRDMRSCEQCEGMWSDLPELVTCFFFQAEDGIRGRNVTGVQTCALPICRGCAHDDRPRPMRRIRPRTIIVCTPSTLTLNSVSTASRICALFAPRSTSNRYLLCRSEERRVGKGGRLRRGRFGVRETGGRRR